MKKQMVNSSVIVLMAAVASCLKPAFACAETSAEEELVSVSSTEVSDMNSATLTYLTDRMSECCDNAKDVMIENVSLDVAPKLAPSIYDLPYTVNGRCYDWRRLWINTGVLTGAFVGTLLVLECLPEDATSWNRAEIQDVPMFKRWHDNVFEKGPEWDHDKFVFNYILHPYAGAVYYMAARSCGFNAWQSLLYCSIISNIGWEFGVEAFMERPSIQDLFITPLVGSLIGEGFYKIKRYLVENDYHLWGSPVLGNAVAFLIDPVNEIVGLFGGNRARMAAKRHRTTLSSSPIMTGSDGTPAFGLSVSYTF